jgi:hypothetical protein
VRCLCRHLSASLWLCADGPAEINQQQEYELAWQLKKDCLCFIVQKGFAWNPELIEFDKRAPLQAFLTTVQKENTVAYFTTTVDFESKFSASLGKLLLEKSSASNQHPATSSSSPSPPRRSSLIRTHCRRILPDARRKRPCSPTGCTMRPSRCWCSKPSAAWAKLR